MEILLPILVLLPLVAGGFVLWLSCKQENDSNSELAGLVASVAALLLSLVLLTKSLDDKGALGQPGLSRATVVADLEFAPKWLSLRMPAAVSANQAGWQLSLAADGLGSSLAFLTTLVTTIILFVSKESVSSRRGAYAGWILLVEGGLLMAFLAGDLLLFYVGFELTLVPVLFLLSGWGEGKIAVPAAKRFVLFTLAGSIPMVVGLVGLASVYSSPELTSKLPTTVNISELSHRAALTKLALESNADSPEALTRITPEDTGLSAADYVALVEQVGRNEKWIFWLLVLGLGIKMAILPLHTWLPATYRAAHPTTAALLAAVVLKLGLFGFLRVAIPLAPSASLEYGPVILGGLGAAAIVFGALVALAQTDLRLLLAYSSLSHVGFITVGMFSLTAEGLTGAAIQIFNHGITTAGMFLVAAALFTRRGTWSLPNGSHGLASVYPRIAVLLVFFTVAGAGMPGLNNFVGEMLTLAGMASRNAGVAAVAVLGILLGAWYSFRLLMLMMFGPVESSKATLQHREDLKPREIAGLTVLAALCLVIGVFPASGLRLVKSDMERLAKIFAEVKDEGETRVGMFQSPTLDGELR